MIQISDKTQCCGCTACEEICPVNCISMQTDYEGFQYPKADSSKCVGCGACERVCPIQNPKAKHIHEQWGYIVQNVDERVRAESTSGGFFTALADYVIDRNGVVFGAAYGDNLQVHHTYTVDKNRLNIFRNSKYVQSSLGGGYTQAGQGFLGQGNFGPLQRNTMPD